MFTVTQRISQVRQPGRYIKVSQFDKILFHDDFILKDNINASPSIMGTAVDYMTRFISGGNAANAFRFALTGAIIANEIDYAKNLLHEINGLDDKSLTSAYKLAAFDSCYRSSFAFDAKRVPDPDKDSLHNMKIFVERSINLFRQYGPVVTYGFDFMPYGYTQIISAGDGDFLTRDTLWDFKVAKSGPQTKDAMQVLIYWLMGRHSGQAVFDSITKLGIFNPRLNTAYILDTSKIAGEVITEIENEIICYNPK